MSSIRQIILTGSISIDRIMNFSGSYKDMIQPEKIHVISLSVLISQLQNTPGGIAANIAYTLALLGEKPILTGYVGQDAKEYINSLSQVGVNTQNIQISSKNTSTFTVLTDRDDNQIGGFYPGAMEDNVNINLNKLAHQNDFIVISANDPQAMRSLVNQSKSNKFSYMYDVSQQVSNIPIQDIMIGIKNSQITIVNDYEREVIVQKSAIPSEQLPTMCPVFITTLGSQGSLIEGTSLTKPFKISAAKIEQAVDPTGAGDAYRAGFLYGLKNNLPLDKCGQIGAVAAVFAIEKHGTQSHNFSLPGFNNRLSNNFGFTID